MRIWILMILWWLAIGEVVTYSGIWQSQHAPTMNVTADFGSGYVEHGSLYRAWDRHWVLTRPDGIEVHFLDLSKVTISVRPPAKAPEYWDLWRSWMPSVLISVLFIAGMLGPLRGKREGA